LRSTVRRYLALPGAANAGSLREEASAFLRLAFPALAVRSVTSDETELHRFERRLDKLLSVELAGETEPSWYHF
jgi:hypothetical protein